MQIKEKPWGREEIILEEGNVTIKRIIIHAGECLSLQYHNEKAELLCCIKGKALILGEKTFMDYIYIPPRTIHRIFGETDCELIEMSIGNDEDIVRLKDKYHRKDE